VIFSVACLLARGLLSCLLVPRHENVVLRRRIGRVRYQPCACSGRSWPTGGGMIFGLWA
jgi:hypothetical protein